MADASHELRTPVAVIKTELEGALRAGGHDPQVREALVAAVEECDHLAQLAEDLLVVARTGEGELPRAARAARRARAARAACGGASPTAPRERGRDDPVDVGRRAARCTRDELRLRQALGNLVDNALRYGAGRDRAALAPRARTASELEVSDQGDGFAPDFADRAFERFARGDRRPHARRARASGSRSCGRSPRRTAAARSSCRAPGATVRIWLPNGAS